MDLYDNPLVDGLSYLAGGGKKTTFTTPQYFYGSGSKEEKEFRALYEYHYGPGSYAKDVLANELKMDPMTAKSAEAYKGQLLADSNAKSAGNIQGLQDRSVNLVNQVNKGNSPLNSIANYGAQNDLRQMRSNAFTPNVNRLMANKDIADQKIINNEGKRAALQLANKGYIRDQQQMQLGLAQQQGDMANTRSNALNSMQNAAAAAQQKSDQAARDMNIRNEAAKMQAMGTLAITAGQAVSDYDKMQDREKEAAGQAAGQGAANSNPSDKTNKKNIVKLLSKKSSNKSSNKASKGCK